MYLHNNGNICARLEWSLHIETNFEHLLDENKLNADTQF